MQMVQMEGGESVNDEDCGEKEEWCMVVRWEKRKCVFVFIVMCVLLLVYQARVLL